MNRHASVRAYRELYYPSPGPGVAQWLSPAYVGSGPARSEILFTSSESDAYRGWLHRESSDGGPFYSPSSIHRFVRSRRNGVLYWLANIVPDPPSGNGPRYPLCIAEIDEDRAAVRRGSLIELDTRQAGEPAALQLSNFSVLENRAGDVEIYVTLLGLRPDDFWRSDVYRYVFSPPGRPQQTQRRCGAAPK